MEQLLNLPATTVLPWVWLGVLILCIIIEVCTFSLTTLWAAIASLPMIFVSMTPLSFSKQVILFVLITLFQLVSLRPVVLKKMKLGIFNTHIIAAPGDTVTVVKKVSKRRSGEVKLSNGMRIKAKSLEKKSFEKDTVCTIKKIKGNTVFI